jgi:hypothetical protein
MLVRVTSAFVVRRVGAILVVPALVLAFGAGCGHKRTAMRPVYAVPAPAATTVVPDPCPPGATTPGFPEAGSTLTNPSAPSLSPPAGGASDEPRLSPAVVPEASGSGNGQGPALTPPQTSRRLDRRPPPRLSSRGAELRSAVEPFVNDPNDLFAPPKADRPWRYVVLHHSANARGGYDQIDREHRKNLGTAGCGYHFVIGNGTDSPDGQIEVARRWSDQKGGAHCRNARTPDVNDYGIGICLIGNLDDAPPTPKQVAAARALVAYLRDRYQISADHVGTHAVLAQGPTACPGKRFPTEAILGTRGVALR